jgi:hypothetical protein
MDMVTLSRDEAEKLLARLDQTGDERSDAYLSMKRQLEADRSGSAAPNIDANLVQRCQEILAWKSTGILPGHTLRDLGKEISAKFGGSAFLDDGLQQAEAKTINEALRLVVTLAN